MKSVLNIVALTYLALGAACGQPPEDSAPAGTSEPAAAGEGTGTSALTRPDEPSTPVAGTAGEGSAARSEIPPPVAAASAEDLDARGRRSVYSGVYTLAQAERGLQIQQKECSVCHTLDDWGEGNVLTGYTGMSALDLIEKLRTTMPMDGPGRLEYQQYTDVAAFIFQLNGAPPGTAELAADQAELAKIRLEYRRR